MFVSSCLLLDSREVFRGCQYWDSGRPEGLCRRYSRGLSCDGVEGGGAIAVPVEGVRLEVGPVTVVGVDSAPKPPETVGSAVRVAVNDASGSIPQATAININRHNAVNMTRCVCTFRIT